jgi:acetate---CoA ligase (ADP-forming)
VLVCGQLKVLLADRSRECLIMPSSLPPAAPPIDPVARLIKPRSVAVIGASADSSRTTGRPVHYLRKHGFAGDIWPVNPRVATIEGLPCYPDIAALPGVPDVGLVLLGSDRVLPVIRELAAIGTAAAIVLASGYGEAGAAGAVRQAELLAAAGPMRLLGPNTMGLVNLTDDIPLSPSGALVMDKFIKGGIAVVSQSGGILGSVLSRAKERGIGMSKLISTSNEADLELADFVDFLANDPATEVIALYIEAVRDPAKFRRAMLNAAAKGKPVVAYKVGRSEAGAKAAVSHTGALAGSDRLYDALFAEVGVIRAQTFSDFLDIPVMLATKRVPHGRRVAILTSTGGAGTLVSDALGVAGFQTPPPDAVTASRLRALQKSDLTGLDRNPIDVTLAGLQPDLLRGAIQALLDSPTYDALVLIVGSSGVANPELMAGAIEACLPSSSKPVLAYVSPHAPAAASLLTARGVPAFTQPEACASVLAALWDKARWPKPAARPPSVLSTPVASNDFLSGALDEAQAKALFQRFGIASVAESIVTTPAEAATAASAFYGQWGSGAGARGHVVLKILSAQITHKSDVGGVAVWVAPGDVAARVVQMAADVKAATGLEPQRYLVQEMVQGGTEMIVGFHRDALGPAILLGHGGVTAELFKDTAMRLLPPGGLSAGEVLDLLRTLATWPLLDGYRGRPKADVSALVHAVVAFSQMVDQLGDRLIEAEINPLLVLADGRGVRAADGVVVLR